MKKTEVEIEYDSKFKHIYIWNLDSDLILCEDFESILGSERKTIEKIFGRKFKWK